MCPASIFQRGAVRGLALPAVAVVGVQAVKGQAGASLCAVLLSCSPPVVRSMLFCALCAAALAYSLAVVSCEVVRLSCASGGPLCIRAGLSGWLAPASSGAAAVS